MIATPEKRRAVDAPNGSPAADPWSVLEATRADLTRIGNDAIRLLQIRGLRARARVRRAVAAVVGSLVLACCVASLALVAAVFLVLGLAGALTEFVFGGNEWAGQLAGGALILGGALAFVTARNAQRNRQRTDAVRRALGAVRKGSQ